jgi:hypothetical protein
MTESEILLDLKARKVRLRTTMPDGRPIDLYDKGHGNYIAIPLSNYTQKIYDVILNNASLSEQQKQIITQYFVYAMAIQEDVNGIDQVYTDLTWEEFDILYCGNRSSVLKFKDNNSVEIVLVEIPIMDDDTGERSLIYLLSTGYNVPEYTLFARSARAFKILEK